MLRKWLTYLSPLRILGRILNCFFNDDIRRFMFISTLAAYLTEINKPDRFLIEKLNNLFNLCSDPKALLFLMGNYEMFWGKFDTSGLKAKGFSTDNLGELVHSKLAISQKRILANHIIQHTTKALKYGSKKQMRNDIYKLFNGLQDFVPTTA